MKVMSIAGAAALALALAGPASAQYNQREDAASRQSVTSTDIQRLQDQVYDAGNEIGRLRQTDQAAADRLQARLDEARDEVIYLRVKMRKEGSITRDEYTDVRREIDAIRGETRDNARPSSQARPNGSNDSGNYGERGDYGNDLYQGNEVLITAGSTMRGLVSSVTPASRTERKGALTVVFDQVRINGRTYPIHATVTQALESEGIRGEAGRIGAGAGVGAIIGGILGGAKGALLGILIGGGGTIAATEGTDVNLPAGTILRVRLEQALTLR